jgi:glucose-6-phosphate 1-dehydrogenase
VVLVIFGAAGDLSWGPESAEALIAQDGSSWLQPVFLNQQNKEG